MTVSHRFRNFGPRSKHVQNSVTPDQFEHFEEQKLQSFEAGYQAGWDDALKAEAEDTAKLNEDFIQNLHDITFTYHEAVIKVSSALEPILTGIVERVLPELSKGSLSAHIIDQLQKLTYEALDTPIEIVLSPANDKKIQTLTSEYIQDSFVTRADASFSDEQVLLQVGALERQIDFEALIDSVSKTTRAFFHEITEQQKDG